MLLDAYLRYFSNRINFVFLCYCQIQFLFRTVVVWAHIRNTCLKMIEINCRRSVCLEKFASHSSGDKKLIKRLFIILFIWDLNRTRGLTFFPIKFLMRQFLGNKAKGNYWKAFLQRFFVDAHVIDAYQGELACKWILNVSASSMTPKTYVKKLNVQLNPLYVKFNILLLCRKMA